jgi:hypothetical protein
MRNPQYKILAGAKVPIAATSVAVAAEILNAGAVPAVPIIIDSTMPNELAASVCCLFMVIIKAAS